ncbi:HTH DNA binding protein [Staphylococcus phage CF5]|uniref:HTH DNA binding protein n=1 Tax=Staphylococcus phage CF5 TaxID=3113739 RepID=A0AAX4J6T7_9CAUD|nr:HTH DNA binding protein [Staphylococcus phage CF5]
MATKTTRKLYSYLEHNATDNKFHVSTKKELADALGVSVSTLSNNLKKLEEDNKIIVVSKRGSNGGIVINLVRDYNTEDLKDFNQTQEDIITSEYEYAIQLRKKHFPNYHYQRRENKRRTKKELIQYQAIKDEHRRIIDDMNFYSRDLLYPTKEVFNMSYDPNGFYSAYILCKLYDQYTVSHMSAKHESHLKAMQKAKNKDDYRSHKRYAEYYREKMIQNLPKNSITEDFFGSKLFNIFYNFYLKVKDKDINIFKYMQNVFKNMTFYYENGKQQSPIPPPNFFSSDKYMSNYQNYIKGVKKGINSSSRHLGETEYMINSSDYIKNPAVLQLQQLYTIGLNSELHDIDKLFEQALELENVSYGIYGGMKHIIWLQYNLLIEDNLKELPTNDKNILNKYVKQCIINDYSPISISNIGRLSMFTMQREYLISTKQLSGGLTNKDLLPISLGTYNIPNLDSADKHNLELNGDNYLYMRRYSSTYKVLRMFGDYLGYEVNLRDVKYLIEKYKLNKIIPLTKEGMLDYNKVTELVEEDVK